MQVLFLYACILVDFALSRYNSTSFKKKKKPLQNPTFCMQSCESLMAHDIILSYHSGGVKVVVGWCFLAFFLLLLLYL